MTYYDVKLGFGRTFKPMAKEDFTKAINETWERRWLLYKAKEGHFVEKFKKNTCNCLSSSVILSASDMLE